MRRGVLRRPDGGWQPVAVKLLNPPPGDQAMHAYNRHLRTLVQVRCFLRDVQIRHHGTAPAAERPKAARLVILVWSPLQKSNGGLSKDCSTQLHVGCVRGRSMASLRAAVQEITILGSVRHPNVVQLLGGSLQPGASFLVEELCGMTLGHAIYGGAEEWEGVGTEAGASDRGVMSAGNQRICSHSSTS